MSIISNHINLDVDFSLYDFNLLEALLIHNKQVKIWNDNFSGVSSESKQVLIKEYPRNKQNQESLNRIKGHFVKCKHGDWLSRRGINPDFAFSIDYENAITQDLLDYYVIPSDHIIEEFGLKVIDGPVFPDIRNGRLVGFCIRNVSNDLDYASAEKYTISNYGWFIYGYDWYKSDDEVYIVEGVFDAIKMVHNGYNAVALANAAPTPYQLSCLKRKFKNLRSCLDNDFWGDIGSYATYASTGIPIFKTVRKDPGSYIDDNIELFEVNPDDLLKKIVLEIPKYNDLVERDELKRDLPYNKD